MPRYKLSPEERAAEKERKDNLRNIMKGLDVKNFDDLKDVFKMMVGEMLENGLDGEPVYETDSYEAKIKIEREDVDFVMQRAKDSKMTGLTGEWSMKVKKVFS